MKKANILLVFSCLSALISSCNGCDEYSPAPSSLKTRWTDGVKATNVLLALEAPLSGVGRHLEPNEKFASDLAVFASEGIAGAVYTQITDVETEINGLMTYDREVDKFPVDRIRTANKKVILSLCADE